MRSCAPSANVHNCFAFAVHMWPRVCGECDVVGRSECASEVFGTRGFGRRWNAILRSNLISRVRPSTPPTYMVFVSLCVYQYAAVSPALCNCTHATLIRLCVLASTRAVVTIEIPRASDLYSNGIILYNLHVLYAIPSGVHTFSYPLALLTAAVCVCVCLYATASSYSL